MSSFVAGILRCDVCQDEHKAIGKKHGPLYIAKGMECGACHRMACVWDDVRHFDTGAEAMDYVTTLEINEPPPKDAS